MSSCVASLTRVPADMCAVTCALLAALVVARSAAAQEPALRCRHERCRYLGNKGEGWSWYEVDDDQVISIEVMFERLTMTCNGHRVLESPVMPRAEPTLRVTHVMLELCPLPAARSLADTLATLGVTLQYSELDAPGWPHGNLTLSSQLTAPPLEAKHFAGLEHLVSLEIIGIVETPLGPKRGFLAPLRSLRFLTIHVVLLPTSELPVTPTLEELELSSWNVLQPAALQRCDKLRTLRLTQPKMKALPDGWLENCSCLQILVISYADQLTTLPPNLLVGTSALMHFELCRGSLETLPAGLLDYSLNLRTLRLNDNHLRSLPSGMFNAVARQLRELDLSLNELGGGAIEALAPLVELTELDLSFNVLGDICGIDGYSPIRYLTKLKKLLLTSTSVARSCQDWREDMTLLEKLDLSNMNLSTELSFEDLQYTRTVEAEVILQDLPVTVVRMSRQDFNNAAQNLSHGVAVYLNAVLECDCRMYWTRRALDLSLPALQHVQKLSCSDGRLLRATPPENMECVGPEECEAADLPTECTCTTRPDDYLDHDRMMVRVHCENATLDRFPRLRALNDSTERLYELLLAHNNIAKLNTEDLQHTIKGLDLRNNSLKGVDEEMARRLGNMDGPLRLAGNPLDCSCHAAPLLRALLHRDPALTDRGDATCSDGIPLYNAPIVDCSQHEPSTAPTSIVVWLTSGLAVLLALVVAIMTCLASRERRFFMLAVLHRWGFLWCFAETEEDESCRYDAFVTFSYKDGAKVFELIARLEPPYQLCVHYRDWIPGCFISEQIVKSVRESRRTVALVSKHFLASSWARAEFREAHAAAMLDARPRLIVVLLEEPAALEMDEQLRRYVTTHTYLRWGEPWFWDKLAVALPRPRAPSNPESASHASLPTLAMLPAPPAQPPMPALELSAAPAPTMDASASSFPVSLSL